MQELDTDSAPRGARAAAAALRTLLPPAATTLAARSSGVLVLALGLALWAGCWAAALLAGAGLQRWGLGAALGVVAGWLVIVGHEAEHGSLTPWPRGNTLASRLAFVPAWQSASGWAQEHQRHHAFTNLKQRDEGYPPPSPDDWLAMPAWRRLWYRAASSWPGLWLNYADVWWRCVIRSHPPTRNPMPAPALARRRLRRFDVALVLAFAALQALAIRWHDGSWWGLLPMFVLPFVVMNWLVSAITLIHHRHAQVRWFDDEQAWRTQQQPAAVAVHLALPPLLQRALLNIFEHGAHHLELRRPFAALPQAQAALNRARREAVVVPAVTGLVHLHRLLRDCQLYDYNAQRWLRFSDVRPRASSAGSRRRAAA